MSTTTVKVQDNDVDISVNLGQDVSGFTVYEVILKSPQRVAKVVGATIDPSDNCQITMQILANETFDVAGTWLAQARVSGPGNQILHGEEFEIEVSDSLDTLSAPATGDAAVFSSEVGFIYKKTVQVTAAQLENFITDDGPTYALNPIIAVAAPGERNIIEVLRVNEKYNFLGKWTGEAVSGLNTSTSIVPIGVYHPGQSNVNPSFGNDILNELNKTQVATFFTPSFSYEPGGALEIEINEPLYIGVNFSNFGTPSGLRPVRPAGVQDDDVIFEIEIFYTVFETSLIGEAGTPVDIVSIDYPNSRILQLEIGQTFIDYDPIVDAFLPVNTPANATRVKYELTTPAPVDSNLSSSTPIEAASGRIGISGTISGSPRQFALDVAGRDENGNLTPTITLTIDIVNP